MRRKLPDNWKDDRQHDDKLEWHGANAAHWQPAAGDCETYESKRYGQGKRLTGQAQHHQYQSKSPQVRIHLINNHIYKDRKIYEIKDSYIKIIKI